MQLKDMEESERITGLRDKTDAWREQPPVFDLHNNNIDVEETENLKIKRRQLKC